VENGIAKRLKSRKARTSRHELFVELEITSRLAGGGRNGNIFMPHTSTDSTRLENIEVTLYSDVLDKLGEKRTIGQCLDLIRADTTLSQKVTQLRSLYRKADDLRQSANGCEEANDAFKKATQPSHRHGNGHV
jgi:hypothetical protein